MRFLAHCCFVKSKKNQIKNRSKLLDIAVLMKLMIVKQRFDLQIILLSAGGT